LQRPAIVERVKPVIVLNGGSSSGKTSIARCLQRLLGPTWMTLDVDDLIRALPGGDGMARLQAARVHEGVVYDLVVDTTAASAADCARTIASHLATFND
jgi:chloramphenicol 3-O-phosphotransferase